MKPLPSTPDRWLRVKSITADALECAETERAGFLVTACAGDETLRAEVESLLAAHAGAGGFLDAPALAQTGAAMAVAQAAGPSPPAVASGQRIGPYRVLEELGHGGMGVVYLAERADAAFEKRVAIKVVRGGFAGEALMQRFREERRILATLDHPNIARLLDGGATDGGLPYLVMEYVDGIALDVYAQTAPLSIEQRLVLFSRVCAAVQYAHQRLVIHRDLKARNILVTADGTPKLLDFGIAKLLEPGVDPEEQTRTGLRALSLEGASPEQMRGEPLTVTSDVYALGVLLYRLLSGQSPYGPARRSEADLMRAIAEEAPVRPSSVAPVEDRRALRGELDWITLQALRKEPDRRYPSVEQLAGDLQRHLGGRPVAAAPDSWGYRARKFVTRNRTAVAVAALLAVSLAAGVTATLWQARRAEEQRARAERRFNDVRKLASSVVGELHDAIKDLPGATPARKILVARAVEYLDSLAGEARGDESLQRELAGAYAKIGDAQGNPYRANLGQPAEALSSYQKAYAIHAALAEAHPADPETQRELAASQARLADMAWAKGDYPEALRRYREAMGKYEALAAADAARLDDRHDVNRLLNKIGQVHSNSGDLPAALQTYRQALPLTSSLAAAKPDSVVYRRGFAIASVKIGDVAHLMHDFETSFASHRQAEQLFRALARDNPASADLRRDHALALARVALGHQELGRPAESVPVHRETLGLQQALARADPDNVQTQFDMADVHGNLGQALHALGDHRAAAEAIRLGISIAEAAYARNPGYTAGRRNFASHHVALGEVLARTGATSDALEAYREATSLLEVEPVRSEDPALLAEGYAGMGDAQAMMAGRAPPGARAERWQAARRSYEASLAIWIGLRDQGKLAADQAERPKQVEQRLAICLAALAPAVTKR